MSKIAIIGGGIAGSSLAIYFQRLGLDVSLFEKRDSLVYGPPMCHLHSGGNLYPEISLSQRIQLLKESIELVRFYPQSIDFRPTIVSVPKDVNINLDEIILALEEIKSAYKKLIEEDNKNKVLGEVQDYYKIYNKEDVLKLQNQDVKKPTNLDEWIIPFAKNVNLDEIKFPIILVQEYGLNVFRIASSATLMLDKKSLFLNIDIENIKKVGDKYQINGEEYDYLINAAGFESGKIDDMLGIKRERFVEFKSAWVTKWENPTKYWAEVIFLGERGTPKGMGQFTPYKNDYFQLHFMSNESTLYDDGLVKTKDSSYPKLDDKFIEKIEKGWNFGEVEQRTNKAIEKIAKYIPSFKSAKVTPKPLFGAQQIPGNDETLRAAEVSFDGQRYARCEIVKASSIFAMADEISKEFEKLGILDKNKIGTRNFKNDINFDDVTALAKEIAKSRNYPEDLGEINFREC